VRVELTDKGPELPEPIRLQSDIDKLHVPDPAESVPFVGSILRRLRTELKDEVPLIGFAGAPWTLASYMIEGGGSKSFAEIKGLAFRAPQTLHRLLDKIADTVSTYLLFQVESGAQIVQLFDTWAGDLSPADYQEFALPYTQKILSAVGNRVPRILYVNGCAKILESMARSGADVLSIDWRLPIADARRRVGDSVALQGNLDPCLLLGEQPRLLDAAAQILEAAGPTGHIMNLGHGILPPTPVDNARAFVDFVKSFRRSPAS